MAIMTPDDFEAAVHAHLRACGTSGDVLGIRFEHGARKVVVHLARHRLALMAPMISREMRDERALKSVKTYISHCWQMHQWHESVLAANDFLLGSVDGIHRPYMVESALIRLLADRGMDMERFRSILARGRHRDGGHARNGLEERVWSTFSEDERPAQFEEWCWRSGTTRLPHDFDIGTDIQFRLVGRNGWGLMAYIGVAPGVMWIGGPCPQLWIRNADFPVAVMNSAKGRPLTDVVGIDAFDVAGLKVLNMRHDGKRTVVMISSPKEDATAIAASLRPAAAA